MIVEFAYSHLNPILVPYIKKYCISKDINLDTVEFCTVEFKHTQKDGNIFFKAYIIVRLKNLKSVLEIPLEEITYQVIYKRSFWKRITRWFKPV